MLGLDGMTWPPQRERDIPVARKSAEGADYKGVGAPHMGYCDYWVTSAHAPGLLLKLDRRAPHACMSAGAHHCCPITEVHARHEKIGPRLTWYCVGGGVRQPRDDMNQVYLRSVRRGEGVHSSGSRIPAYAWHMAIES